MKHYLNVAQTQIERSRAFLKKPTRDANKLALTSLKDALSHILDFLQGASFLKIVFNLKKIVNMIKEVIQLLKPLLMFL